MLRVDERTPAARKKPSIGAAIGSIGAGVAKKVAKKPSVKKASKRSSGRSVGSSAGRSVRNSGGGGGGSSNRRNSGGGGGGGGSAPKAPSIPSLEAFLASDPAYQSAIRSGKASLGDFISDVGRRRGEAGTQFNQTSASMERDRVQQLEDLKNEFASRGLINSGLYGDEQGRFQQQFTEQLNALKQQQAALLADLLSQETNYKREYQQSIEAAKQQALARRSAKYSIG